MTTLKRSIMIALALLMTAVISGCSHKTTISEANNHLEIKSQEILINSYVTKIQDNRKALTDVPAELDVFNNPKPTDVQPDLATFLLANDCATAADPKACFQRYRLVVIKMSRRIDFLNARLYVAKGTIGNLINNLNGVIDNLSAVKMKVSDK